jgi:hypothetical protein
MSDEYLQMVLALPDEFFKDWKWEDGDAFLYKMDGDWIESYIGQYAIENNVIMEPNLVEYFIPVEGEIRPLPSQKQLQEISGLDWDLYYHDIVKNYSEYDSAEQAGLARVMYVKYHKKWDGEKWI